MGKGQRPYLVALSPHEGAQLLTQAAYTRYIKERDQRDFDENLAGRCFIKLENKVRAPHFTSKRKVERGRPWEETTLPSLKGCQP